MPPTPTLHDLDSETIEIIYKVARRLAPKYRFGYHDNEDIVQEAVIMSLEALKNYDDTYPLENFLYVHIKNRLFNYRRDNYERFYEPCNHCKHYNGGACEFLSDDALILDCPYYRRRMQRNESKKNIMSPISIEHVRNDHESGMKLYSSIADIIDDKETIKYIDTYLSVNMRQDYIRLLLGYKLPKYRLNKLKEAIGILLDRRFNEKGGDDDE